MTEATVSSSDAIRLSLIIEAFEKGTRHGDIKPESQMAPWFVNGLRWLEERKILTAGDIKRLDSMGGTDHPDPWFK